MPAINTARIIDYHVSEANFNVGVAKTLLPLKTMVPRPRRLEALVVLTAEIAMNYSELELVDHVLAIVDAICGPDDPKDGINEFRQAIAQQIMGE